MYRVQLGLYEKIAGLKLRDPLARYALVIAAADPQCYLDGMTLEVMFHQNRIFKDIGYNILFDTIIRLALKDIFEDPQGEFFVDDTQHADIALYMINYMSTEPQ